MVAHHKQSKAKPPFQKGGVFALLRAVVLSPEKIRIGTATDVNNRACYVVVVKRREGWYPLFTGSRLPLVVRMALPALLYIDSGMVPLSLHTAEIDGNEDPDGWIERHESELVPSGFTHEQLVTAYVISQNSIRTVAAEAEQLRSCIAAAGNSGIVASCIPALQGVANAWKSVFTEPYLVWKATSTGSVIATIAEGAVNDIGHFWADTGDITDAPAEVCAEAETLMRSMSRSVQPKTCVVFPELLLDSISKVWTSDAVRLVAPPVIPHCATLYHEAFGNAVGSTTPTAQLLTFEQLQVVQKMQKFTSVAAQVLRFAAAACIGLALVVAGYIAIGRVCISNDRSVMVAIDNDYAHVMTTAAKRDSLTRELTRKSSFVAEESAITRLLSDLQEVFPEGAAAEEITIAEKGAHTWGVVVRAYAHSAALMQPVVTNLQKIKGVNEVRMVYSEQVTGKKQAAGIRFKIEAIWR